VSVFTEGEIAYLQGQTMGRLATVGPDGQPHVVPLTYRFNPDEDAIDLGGIQFGATKKWRDAGENPRVTFLVDEAGPEGARAVEIRGLAELHETGGSTINPRFPNFVEQFIRLRPTRIVSWGMDEADRGRDFTPYGRDVSPR
jgi:pyridoxamine 5'-phosphate oxidase family protein